MHNHPEDLKRVDAANLSGRLICKRISTLGIGDAKDEDDDDSNINTIKMVDFLSLKNPMFL